MGEDFCCSMILNVPNMTMSFAEKDIEKERLKEGRK